MDWDKLRVFYYVAKAGSFIRAADTLNLTQSTLSRSIQIVEHAFNTPLFHRVPKGVVLTKQGEVLFSRVEKIFDHIEEAKMLMQDESAQPSGPLKVASTVSVASSWLPEYLPGFAAAYPEITLQIVGHDENLDRKTREADVAIRAFLPNAHDWVQTYLLSCCLQLYASPAYLEKFGTPQTPEDLDHHRLLTFGESSVRPYTDVDWLLRVGMQSGRSRTPYVSVNSSHALSRLAGMGLGIVALSKEFPHIDELDLVHVLPQISGPIVDLYYTYPKTLQDSKRVQVFGEYLLRSIPPEFRRTPKMQR